RRLATVKQRSSGGSSLDSRYQYSAVHIFLCEPVLDQTADVPFHDRVGIGRLNKRLRERVLALHGVGRVSPVPLTMAPGEVRPKIEVIASCTVRPVGQRRRLGIAATRSECKEKRYRTSAHQA